MLVQAIRNGEMAFTPAEGFLKSMSNRRLGVYRTHGQSRGSALGQKRSITIAPPEVQRCFVASSVHGEIDLPLNLLALELLHADLRAAFGSNCHWVVREEQGYSKDWVGDRRLKQPSHPHGDPSCMNAAEASARRQHDPVAGCLRQERDRASTIESRIE